MQILVFLFHLASVGIAISVLAKFESNETIILLETVPGVKHAGSYPVIISIILEGIVIVLLLCQPCC